MAWKAASQFPALTVQSVPQPPNMLGGAVPCKPQTRVDGLGCLFLIVKCYSASSSDRSIREWPGASDLRILLPGLHRCAMDGASVTSSICRKSEVRMETLMLLERVAWLSSDVEC